VDGSMSSFHQSRTKEGDYLCASYLRDVCLHSHSFQGISQPTTRACRALGKRLMSGPISARMLAQTTTFLLCTSSPAHRSYTTFIDHLQTEMDGRRDAQPGSNAPLRASPRVASDRSVVLVGHPGSDFWSGSQLEYQTDLWCCTRPAAILPFFMRGGACSA